MVTRGMHAAEPDGREAGFSLAEVLVVLLLVSLMAGSMAVMTGQFRQLLANSDRNGEQLALQAAARHLAWQIGQAVALPLTGGGSVSGAVFMRGRPDRVEFVAVARLGAKARGLRTLAFELDGGKTLVQLSRFRRPDLAALPSSDGVLSGVDAVQFSYFGAVETGGKPEWRGEWTRADALPSSVTVTVSKRSAGGHALSATQTELLSVR